MNYQRDDGETGFVLGTELGQTRQARHADLDQDGNNPFDFVGGTARDLGRHLHLDVGHVGKGIDRQLACGIESKCEPNQRQYGQHNPLLESEADNRLGITYELSPPLTARRRRSLFR